MVTAGAGRAGWAASATGPGVASVSAAPVAKSTITRVSPKWIWSPDLRIALLILSPFTMVPRVDPRSMS
jgi:hypothetical protein